MKLLGPSPVGSSASARGSLGSCDSLAGPSQALAQQNEALFQALQRQHELSDAQISTLRRIFANSGYIGQGNPAVTSSVSIPPRLRVSKTLPPNPCDANPLLLLSFSACPRIISKSICPIRCARACHEPCHGMEHPSDAGHAQSLASKRRVQRRRSHIESYHADWFRQSELRWRAHLFARAAPCTDSSVEFAARGARSRGQMTWRLMSWWPWHSKGLVFAVTL